MNIKPILYILFFITISLIIFVLYKAGLIKEKPIKKESRNVTQSYSKSYTVKTSNEMLMISIVNPPRRMSGALRIVEPFVQSLGEQRLVRASGAWHGINGKGKGRENSSVPASLEDSR